MSSRNACAQVVLIKASFSSPPLSHSCSFWPRVFTYLTRFRDDWKLSVRPALQEQGRVVGHAHLCASLRAGELHRLPGRYGLVGRGVLVAEEGGNDTMSLLAYKIVTD